MSNVLFALTGSIACYKACAVVSRLAQEGHSVQTVMSEAATHFVGTATLEGLTRRPVVTGMWERGTALEHIELTKWADVAVVCPATANTLARHAAGLADDPLGALFLAWPHGTKPWLVFPAMNGNMWMHPATQHAVRTLAGWGVRVVDPDRGAHACGDEGGGRLPEPEAVLAILRPLLTSRC